MPGALDLITLKEARTFVFPQGTPSSASDDLLQDLISATSESIQKYCGQNFIQQAYQEQRNGNGKRALFAFHPPVASSPAPTVTENGVTLVVATGYSITADVVVDLAGGQFRRQAGVTQNPVASCSGLWSEGFGNVVLGYTGGYALANVPNDLKMLVKYMVGQVYRQVDKKQIGQSAEAFGQGSLSLLEDLPKLHMRTLSVYSRPMVPPT